jgi:hypothetical protein
MTIATAPKAFEIVEFEGRRVKDSYYKGIKE